MLNKTTIQQNTPEWIDAKMQTIGGSEVYALVLDMMSEQEIKKYLPRFVFEKSYTSSMIIALKFLYGLIPSGFSEVNRDYGNAMEEPSIAWFNQIHSGVAKAEYTRNFHIGSNKNASCSPDGYINLTGNVAEYEGANKLITPKDGIGLMEVKTIRNVDARNDEAKMQYLFQCNWNAFICDLRWYCIFCTYAKDFSYETDYNKGVRSVYAKTNNLQKLQEELDMNCYFYRTNNAVIKLCIEAFKRFMVKVKEAQSLEYAKMWTVFNLSKESNLLLEEKKLLGSVNDDELRAKYGERLATPEESKILEERYNLLIQEKEIKQRKAEIDAYFIKAIANNSKIIANENELNELCCTNKGTASVSFTPTLASKSIKKYFNINK